jgi:hypothetical protein
MIRSGLKDDSLDLAQIWKQMFTLANPAQAAQAATSAGGEHCGHVRNTRTDGSALHSFLHP